MQYFKELENNGFGNFINKNNGEKVINLNRTLVLCVNKAKSIYDCEILTDIPTKTIFCKMYADKIINQVFYMLDTYCEREHSVTIKLSTSMGGKMAEISLLSQRNVICVMEVEIYTGIPSTVIRDSCGETELLEIIATIESKIIACKKKRWR